jgi:hypothetical protein
MQNTQEAGREWKIEPAMGALASDRAARRSQEMLEAAGMHSFGGYYSYAIGGLHLLPVAGCRLLVQIQLASARVFRALSRMIGSFLGRNLHLPKTP